MLQIVHDVAPRAKECFATADGGELNFANNIRALADKSGPCKANVVVDDVGYFAEPFFGDGVISDAVDDVAAQGVHYFSSAGNGSWQQAYQAPLRIIAPTRAGDTSNINLDGVDPNLYQGGFQDFDPGPGVDVAMDEALGFDGDEPGVGILDLQWDDPNDPNGAIVAADPKVHVDGEITAAAPVASIPYDGTAGETIRGLVDAIPSGSTDYILTLKDPAGNILQQVDTGTSPETVFQTLPVTGTYTFEVSGFNGDLGDFTFDINEVLGEVPHDHGPQRAVLRPRRQLPVPIADLNQFSGKPFEIAGFTGGGPLQMVISKGSTDPGTATQLRFQLEGDLQYTEYVQPFAPSVFGHPTAKGASAVAAYDPFRPTLPEDFTSVGGDLPILFDSAGNRFAAAADPAQAGRGGDRRRQHDVLRVGRGGGRRRPAELLRHERGGAARGGDRGAGPAGARRAGVGPADPDAVDPPGRGVPARPRPLAQRGVERRADDHGRRGAGRRAAGEPDARDRRLDDRPAVLPRRSTRVRGRSCRSRSTAPARTRPGSAAARRVRRRASCSTRGRSSRSRRWAGRTCSTQGFPFTVGAASPGIDTSAIAAQFARPGVGLANRQQFQVMTVRFPDGALGGGRFVAFGVDRDSAVTANGDAEGGNSADQLGPGLLFPQGDVVGPGLSYRAVTSTGRVLTGTLRNRIGAGWTAVDGFGYINAEAAVGRRPRR